MAPAPPVIIFATAVAYSDEHVALPEDIVVPVLRFLTDPSPPAENVPTSTALTATLGIGVPGAINAGLFAARILATTDTALRDLLHTKPYGTS
jgi:hypothetical protein